LLASLSARADDRAGSLLGRGAPIPRDYGSWSLFLVCDPAVLTGTPDAQKQMSSLFAAFKSFSEVIGSKHLAVWFTRTQGATPVATVDQLSPTGARDYDGELAGDYCATYHLKSDVFVVVTTSYPTPQGQPGNFSAISLGGLSVPGQLALLGKVAEHVRASDLASQAIGSAAYWERWTQILEDSAKAMGKLVKAVKFSVDVKAFSLEFDGGKVVTR
jgi:hypothetical protein